MFNLINWLMMMTMVIVWAAETCDNVRRFLMTFIGCDTQANPRWQFHHKLSLRGKRGDNASNYHRVFRRKKCPLIVNLRRGKMLKWNDCSQSSVENRESETVIRDGKGMTWPGHLETRFYVHIIKRNHNNSCHWLEKWFSVAIEFPFPKTLRTK